jgi:signal transduction histidine kinase
MSSLVSSLVSRYSLGAWRRGAPVRATIMQYVVLAALLPSALSGYYGSARTNALLCLAAAAWSLAALLPALRKRPLVMAVFVAGVVAISFALVLRDPWFGFYAYAGYAYSVVLLPWPWQLAGVGATTLVAATAQTTGMDRTTPAGMAAVGGVIVANVIFVCGVVWFLHRLEAQHEERGRTLEDLRDANRKLEAALAENAGLQRQLLTQAREAGALDERQRMAREIHDTLAQGLTGIITQLQAAEHAADEPSEWRKHFAAATRLARESLSEARRSVDALRPEPLEKASLSEALVAAGAHWSALNGIPAQVTTTGTERPLRPEAETALLRTALEALANVARHAQATRVAVTLSYMDHQVALDVRDDGRGFDPARLGGTDTTGLALARSVPDQARGAAASRGTLLAGSPRGSGFGLVAMRQRIEGLAGTLQIESEPGAGTGISACIPAPAEAPP